MSDKQAIVHTSAHMRCQSDNAVKKTTRQLTGHADVRVDLETCFVYSSFSRKIKFISMTEKVTQRMECANWQQCIYQLFDGWKKSRSSSLVDFQQCKNVNKTESAVAFVVLPFYTFCMNG